MAARESDRRIARLDSTTLQRMEVFAESEDEDARRYAQYSQRRPGAAANDYHGDRDPNDE